MVGTTNVYFDAPLIYYTVDNKRARIINVDTTDSIHEYTIDRCIKHHIDHLINDTPLLYTTDLAIDALRLILTCYRSNELGRVVEVDEIR